MFSDTLCGILHEKHEYCYNQRSETLTHHRLLKKNSSPTTSVLGGSEDHVDVEFDETFDDTDFDIPDAEPPPPREMKTLEMLKRALKKHQLVAAEHDQPPQPEIVESPLNDINTFFVTSITSSCNSTNPPPSDDIEVEFTTDGVLPPKNSQQEELNVARSTVDEQKIPVQPTKPVIQVQATTNNGFKGPVKTYPVLFISCQWLHRAQHHHGKVKVQILHFQVFQVDPINTSFFRTVNGSGLTEYISLAAPPKARRVWTCIYSS